MARERLDKGDSDSPDRKMFDFVVKIMRSAIVVKGGRRFSFNALVVVGDKRGKVSYGYGKASEVPQAVEKAIKEGERSASRAKRVRITGDTIPHRVIGRYGASKVVMVPAGPGTGLKAGPGVREVLQAAGIANLLTKVHGSTNPINLVKATLNGLQQLRTSSGTAATAVPDEVRELIVELFADPDTPPDVLREGLVRVYAALNQYHMARGGGVLTPDKFKHLIAEFAPV